MPRGHYLDGNVLRDTPNQRAAKVRRMEQTKCPKCGRKGALRTIRPDDFTRIDYCYWRERGLCDYERTTDLGALLTRVRQRMAEWQRSRTEEQPRETP